ncbi:hypothetical protein P8452_67361 [Trifolium repens]|nr:hypothetical protein P8452_67361 [Trifolium repens]
MYGYTQRGREYYGRFWKGKKARSLPSSLARSGLVSSRVLLNCIFVFSNSHLQLNQSDYGYIKPCSLCQC